MNFKPYILFLIFLVGLTACEDRFSQVVEYELPEHESKLVSYCVIDVNNPIVTVDLSKSIGVDIETETAITNAGIRISKNGSPFIDAFKPDSIFTGFDYENPEKMDSLFRPIFSADSPGFPVIGNDLFELEIESPGLQSVHASTSIPQKVEIMQVTFEKDGFISTDGYSSDEIELKFTDPAGEKNYYLVTAKLNVDYGSGMEKWGLYLESIDPRIESGWNLPFISDEGSEALFFEDKDGFDGQSNKLKMTTDIYEDSQNDVSITVRLYSISKEIFDFIKAYQLYQDGGNSIFSEPVVIPSNIVNGYGVFGFYNFDEKTIQL